LATDISIGLRNTTMPRPNVFLVGVGDDDIIDDDGTNNRATS
jgi:hypothetical protein